MIAIPQFALREQKIRSGARLANDGRRRVRVGRRRLRKVWQGMGKGGERREDIYEWALLVVSKQNKKEV